MKSKSAFTLVELLIVVALIGILSSMAVVTFTGSQKRARDAQRRSDLKQYQTGVEAYSLRSGSYPIHQSSAIVSQDAVCKTELKFVSCPVDPKSGWYNYYYISDAAGSSYAVWAQLEAVISTTYLIFCSNGKNTESSTVNWPTVCS
jgi:prepilin-type N-terminal cleavage/methylation domain-containing protein